MIQTSRSVLLIGSLLWLANGGVPAAGLSETRASQATDGLLGLQLAQAHQHGQPAQSERQPTPRSAREPMHPMPDMTGMEHGSAAAAASGHDMSPVDVSRAPAAAPDVRGGQPLEPAMRDGAKEFELRAGVVRWNILPDVEVGAYAYNGQVPGPLIRVRPHDRIRIRVRNELPNATTVHWHGMILPIEQDGVPELSQPPIPPGGTHVYEFEVPDTPGTYFYHTHYNADRQQPLGLYGALIIDDPAAPPQVASEHIISLGEWTVIGGQTYPAMQFGDMLPNYFTISGKSYPATETARAKVGDRILFRLIGSGQFIHPIHIHGGPFEIVARSRCRPAIPTGRSGHFSPAVPSSCRPDSRGSVPRPSPFPSTQT